MVLTKTELATDWDYATANVAFQIEDQLVTGIEENLIGWTVSDTKMDVYVVARAIVEGAIQALSGHGITTMDAIAELNVLNLTLAEDCVTLFNDTAIIRDGDGRALASTCQVERLSAIAPSNGCTIEQDSLQFCSAALGSEDFGAQLTSLLPMNVRRANAYRQRLDLCRPVLWAGTASLGLLTLYFAISTAILSNQAERINDDARAIFEDKFSSSQSFDDIERLAKLQIERGDPIQKMAFDKLLAKMARPLKTLNRNTASITNVSFDETKGISVRLKFASLEHYEQYASALKQQIAFDTKEVATATDGTYATFSTYGNLE